MSERLKALKTRACFERGARGTKELRCFELRAQRYSCTTQVQRLRKQQNTVGHQSTNKGRFKNTHIGLSIYRTLYRSVVVCERGPAWPESHRSVFVVGGCVSVKQHTSMAFVSIAFASRDLYVSFRNPLQFCTAR